MPRGRSGRIVPHELDQSGIERHQRDRPAVACKHLSGARARRVSPSKRLLSSSSSGDAAGDEIAQFAERQHAVGAALKRTALISAALISARRPAAFGQAAERIVVVHHGLAVGADLQIAFDAVAGGDRR